jgi:hypothetical protein
MNKLILRIFNNLNSFYKRWGEPDPYQRSVFTFSILCGFVLNFLISVLYYFTNWELLRFAIWPVGTLLIIFILSCIWFFSKKGPTMKHQLKIQYAESSASGDFVIWLIIVSALVLGWVAIEFYRMGTFH